MILQLSLRYGDELDIWLEKMTSGIDKMNTEIAARDEKRKGRKKQDGKMILQPVLKVSSVHHA